MRHPLVSMLLIWLVVALLLSACGSGSPAPAANDSTTPPAQSGTPTASGGAAQAGPTLVPTPTPDPTQSPWQLGTPTPLFAPLTNECLGEGEFPPQLPGLRYGMNVFLFATDRDRTLTLTNIGGFTWIRQQIHWRDLEGTEGEYVWKPLDQIVNAARAHNFKIMLSVVRSPEWATAEGHSGLPDDPQALATFLGAVATRYQGRVSAYQVWNEPNLSHENGGTPADPSHYLEVLKAAYPAIKKADPCALVVSASLAATHNPDPAVAAEDLPFFEQLYTLDDGAFLRSADIVGAHTGAGSNPPDAAWPADAPEQSHHYFRHIERLHEIMQRHGDQRQVWLTEYGWTVTEAAGAPQPVSEEEQARYLVDALWRTRHWYPWVSGIFVWNLNFSVIAPPDDEKTTFSILEPDWSIRPAFTELQNNVNALRDTMRVPFVPAEATHRYAWTFPGRGQMRTTPIVAPNGTIHAISEPGTLYAIRPDGWLAWQFDAPGIVTARPVRAPDGTLFQTNSGSLLDAVNADGSLRWQKPLNNLSRHSPVYLPETQQVVIVTLLGEIYAFDMAGNEVWSYELGEETTPLIRTSDGALVVVDAAGTAHKLAADGRELWRVPLEGEFWSAPIADTGGGVYVVTASGRVLALNTSGATRWMTDLNAPVIAPPLLGSDGRLYVSSRDGTLSALRVADGVLQWQYNTDSDLFAPPAQAADGTLYQGTDDERLLAIAPDGSLRWQVQVRGGIRARPAIAPDGTLYVPTTGGRLYAFATSQE